MPLESLSNEQINIHDLTLEQEKSENTPKQIYENLKKTSLYDKEEGLWYLYLNEDGELSDNSFSVEYYTEPQLTNVWTESVFDSKKAKETLLKLKQSDLYLSDDKWAMAFNKESDKKSTSETSRTSDRLLAIYTESLFDKEKAEKQYETLKQNEKIYKNGCWKDISMVDSTFFTTRSHLQLLDVLLQTRFDKSKAKESFDNLKLTQLYDDKSHQWNEQFSSSVNYIRYSYIQLLGTLTEAEFDFDNAKKQYEGLKESSFFDKENNMWNHSYNPDSKSYNQQKYVIAQLLGVICEDKFYESSLIQENPKLPETRSY